MNKADEWTPSDARTGLILLGVGGLIVACAVVAMRRGVPFVFWIPAWMVGPLLLLIGGHAIYRARQSIERPGDAE